jgi:anhydro-N-acetylmuramic acid kinase
MPSALRNDLLFLSAGRQVDLELLGRVDIQVGRLFADAVNELLKSGAIPGTSVTAIGSHGQTIYHRPDGDTPFSIQIGDPNTIAQLTGITTVADFRRRDMVAGGEGAPLAPLLHRNCFQSPGHDRVIVNIGGISNITVLARDNSALAFDTGPGNVLMDYWIESKQQKQFDEAGNWAAQGNICAALLNLLMDENYLSLPHPKSTGRELFNGKWLEEKLSKLQEPPAAVDVQASLLEYTAVTITQAISKELTAEEIYVCGGGAHNKILIDRLQELLPAASVATTRELGFNPDQVEAVAFAWMAKQTCEGNKIATGQLTGASEPVILGAIYQ